MSKKGNNMNSRIIKERKSKKEKGKRKPDHRKLNVGDYLR